MDRGKALHIHWTGGGRDSTARLDVVEKRKVPVPTGNRGAIIDPIASHYTELLCVMSVLKI
jgi:hypothetical protein